MINEEKEKEIVSLLEEQKNSKLFLEVTGYISKLDAYIYKLEKQLKQRDEVIDEAMEFVENYDFAHNNVLNFYNGIKNRLQKYKGDNNE